MPEKVTKEEKLVELAIAKAKEVKDYIIGLNDPDADTVMGEEVKVKRPKAEKASEEDTDPIGPSDLKKAPPIPNPKNVEYSNDGLSEREVKDLFEEVIDPKIKQKLSKEPEARSIHIPLKELEMSKKVAIKWGKHFYTKKMGYGSVGSVSGILYIMFQDD
jgi:hypothetical protein